MQYFNDNHHFVNLLKTFCFLLNSYIVLIPYNLYFIMDLFCCQSLI